MNYSTEKDTLIHRILRVPYNLHVTRFREPKRPRATVVFLHGIGNSGEAWKVIAEMLPADVRVIAVDLLGFGKSPKPDWVTYNTRVQARSVAKTLMSLKLAQRPIVVGHSMGSLVAIELAKLFPLVIRRLVLFSPPIYRPSQTARLSRDDNLRKIFSIVKKHPSKLQLLAPYAREIGLTSASFNIQGDIARAFIGALDSSIINQSAYNDIQRLKLPIDLVYGKLDPVVIDSNLKSISSDRANISLAAYAVGHEIRGKYESIAIKIIEGIINPPS